VDGLEFAPSALATPDCAPLSAGPCDTLPQFCWSIDTGGSEWVAWT
jgi:hypothetical protein